MTSSELKDLISSGETSTVQFKETLENKEGFATEMIAMANSHGGKILVGVEDKTGKIKGLDYSQLQTIGNAIANLANDSVKPQIFLTTEVVDVEADNEIKKILVVYIDEGIAKPYKDLKGAIWVKQGADKRRLTENSEQIRLFQQSGLLYADEMVVPNTSANDINMDKVQEYVKRLLNSLQHIDDAVILKNLNIIRNDKATLAGLLFFGNNPQQYRPAFCIKAVAFYGNSIGGTEYKDSVDITGTIPEMFERALHFCRNNLHHTQQGQSFNSEGKLEISEIALKELLQNALTHRDYSKNAPIRLMIFDNRLELISPGALPNSLTIENIKMGNSVVRNNLIVSYSSKLMEYRGLGSGIIHALSEIPDIEFENDRDGEQFIVRIERNSL